MLKYLEELNPFLRYQIFEKKLYTTKYFLLVSLFLFNFCLTILQFPITFYVEKKSNKSISYCNNT